MQLQIDPLRGAGSTNPDGSIASFQWDFDDNTLVDFQSASPATHMFTLPQTVTVTLRVVDDQGAADTDTVPIIVRACQQRGSSPIPSAQAVRSRH